MSSFPPPSGPPPGYPPPSGGGYSGYGGYQGGPGGQQEHPQGTTILILGIVSLVICSLAGPFAWVMGNRAIREIDAAPGRYTNRTSVQVGRILGAIASILLILFAVILVIAIIAGAAGSGSG